MTSLPTDLLIDMFSRVDAQDYLSCKLSCRTISNAMEKKLAEVIQDQCESENPHYIDANAAIYRELWSEEQRGSHWQSPLPPALPPSDMTNKDRTVYTLAHAENHLLATRSDNGKNSLSQRNLVCTRCGKVRDRYDFVDVVATCLRIIPVGVQVAP